MSIIWKQELIAQSILLKLLSSFKVRTILQIFHLSIMIIILLCIGTLYTLTKSQLQYLLEDISQKSFYLESLKQIDVKDKMLQIFWISFIRSISTPIVSLHKLYNFYDQISFDLSNQFLDDNDNFQYENSSQIEKLNFCYSNLSKVATTKQETDKLKNLLQFSTILSTKIFGVQNYLGYIHLQQNHLIDYPCFNLFNIKSYNPQTRPWFHEAQKVYNQTNFSNYEVRLTEHYLTIPFNDYRFSISLPMIDLRKQMIGAWRIHIKSIELQNQIQIFQPDTNIIMTSNSGMLLLCTLYDNFQFNLGNDYFFNQSITGFDYDDWLAITQNKQSNCQTSKDQLICRINKLNQKEYFFVHTSLENYNIKILIYVSKVKYLQFIDKLLQQSAEQINVMLIQGATFILAVSIVLTIIFTILLGKIVNPISRIAQIFQTNRHSSSQTILQKFEKFKQSDHYSTVFEKKNRFRSKQIDFFCKTIHQFMSNFTSKHKKSNDVLEYIETLQYPQKTEHQYLQFNKNHLKHIFNLPKRKNTINIKTLFRQEKIRKFI